FCRPRESGGHNHRLWNMAPSRGRRGLGDQRGRAAETERPPLRRDQFAPLHRVRQNCRGERISLRLVRREYVWSRRAAGGVGLRDGERAAYVLDDRFVEAFAIAGTAEDALAQARRYREAGASELVLTFAGRQPEPDMQYLANASRISR